MPLQETILCGATPSAAGIGPGQILIHDLHSGVSLASFKQSNTASNSLGVLESKNSQGGFILAAQSDKSILNDQIALKIVLPERLTCLALDESGDFCAGGTASGRIYLWETASGILYKAWDAHYRQVNILRFISDGGVLISGSSDSGVSVWSVSRLLEDQFQNELATPYCQFSDHTLAVTDIVCGRGSFPQCRILTSSEDHTVKLWDLASKSLLTTFQFPHAVNRLAWDIAERFLFAACSDGKLHRVDLFQERRTALGDIMEAVGGAGITDIIRVGDDETRSPRKRQTISVGQPITSLCMSLNTTILLVGTGEGLIQLYDVPSHQLLRTITTHKGSSINHLQTLVKPPDLIGHVSLHLQGPGNDNKDTMPVKPIAAFQRIMDPKAREAHELATSLHEPLISFVPDYPEEEFLRDHSFFFTQPADGSSDALSMKNEVQDLRAEVALLRDQLSKAKGLNDAMWHGLVQNLVEEKSSSQAQQRPQTDSESYQRSKKRNRTS